MKSQILSKFFGPASES